MCLCSTALTMPGRGLSVVYCSGAAPLWGLAARPGCGYGWSAVAPRIEIRLLGPVELMVGGKPVGLGGTKQRAVLAMLALAPNQAVSADRLTDGLWQGALPTSAPKMVQHYIWQLRKALPESADAQIVTRGRSYELRIDEDGIDVRRLRRLLATASGASTNGELHAALELWRGDPLADVADEPFAAAEIRELQALRLDALEQLVQDELAAGRVREALDGIDELVSGDPLRERTHALRMLALYRAGRQSEALDAFRSARQTLLEELGVEPGSELRRLQAAILRQDPDLEPLRPTRSLPQPLIIRGVPPLSGRDAELAVLMAIWQRARAGRGAAGGCGGRVRDGQDAAGGRARCARPPATAHRCCTPTPLSAPAEVEAATAAAATGRTRRRCSSSTTSTTVGADVCRGGGARRGAGGRPPRARTAMASSDAAALASAVDGAARTVATRCRGGAARDRLLRRWRRCRRASGRGSSGAISRCAGRAAAPRRGVGPRRRGAPGERRGVRASRGRSGAADRAGSRHRVGDRAAARLPNGHASSFTRNEPGGVIACPYQGTGRLRCRRRRAASSGASASSRRWWPASRRHRCWRSSARRAAASPRCCAPAGTGARGRGAARQRALAAAHACGPVEHPPRELRAGAPRPARRAAARGRRPVRGALHRLPGRGASARRSSPRSRALASRAGVHVVVVASAPTSTAAARATRSCRALLGGQPACSSGRCAARSCGGRSSGPRERVGLSVEPELTDALVAEVEGEPGALPLLSTALAGALGAQRRATAADGRPTSDAGRRAWLGRSPGRGRLRRGSPEQQRAGSARSAAALGRRRRGRRRRSAAERAARSSTRQSADIVDALADRRLLTLDERLGGGRPRGAVARVAAAAQHGSTRTPSTARPGTGSPMPPAPGARPTATRASSTAAPGWPRRSSGAPATATS